LIAALLFIAIIMVSVIWKSSENVDLVKLFRADESNAAVGILSISSHFYFFPTNSFALEIINWQNDRLADAMVNFFEILLLAAISVLILWRLSFLFYPLRQKLQEGSFRRTTLARSYFLLSTAFCFKGGKTAALFKKEALVSIRNPKGMLWFVFLLFIWFAQLGTNLILRHNLQTYETDMSQRLAMLQFLQFIIAVYFICSFTLRFVFPAFSLEKKTAWILASAPVNFKKIYTGKYLFYAAFFVAVGALMSYINVNILNLPFAYSFYSMVLFVSVVIFIVTLGLSMGAVFPNYETDDPEVISTSMPGLFFTALSLIYGSLGAGVLYYGLVDQKISGLLFFVFLTFALIVIILLKTPSLAGKKDYL
jgi:Putative ATP-binding cassette